MSMSDTKTVREPCDHGMYDAHPYSILLKFGTGGNAQVGMCPGGKEIVLHPADPYPTQPGRTRYWREERVVEE